MSDAVCSVEGCERQVNTRNFCSAHYQRFRKHGDPTFGRLLNEPAHPCLVEGCERRARSRGWCPTHYSRWVSNGDPLKVQNIRGGTLQERFDAFAVKGDGCWAWTGDISNTGYGRLLFDNVRRGAHVVSYELHVGPIPNGMVIDHLCHNPVCTRPDHLRVVTRGQNCQHRIGASPTASSSGVLGVQRYYKRKGWWHVRVILDGHQYWGGIFDNIPDATEAAIALRNRLFTHNDHDRQESA